MLALLPPFGPRSSSATSLSRLLSHIGTLAHSRIEHTPKSSITRTCNTYLTQIHVLHVGSNASVFLSLSPSLFFFPWSRFNTFPPPSSPLSFEFLHRIGNQSLYLPFLLPLPSYVHPTTRSVLVLRKKKRGGGGGRVVSYVDRSPLPIPPCATVPRLLPPSYPPCHDAKVSNCSSDSQINVLLLLLAPRHFALARYTRLIRHAYTGKTS